MDWPLSGIRVFELGSSVAAPYGASILAELGAEVIKVERPEGDDARHWVPYWHEISTVFRALNRNKKSVSVTMRNEVERARLKTLIVETADVVLQNMRPGTVERLGLDAESLRAVNPRLIYCNMGAFGRTGPRRDKPGYDPLMQACGGIMSITGEEGRAPVRVGPSIVDMGTGMWAAIGILGALRMRDRTGVGCVVDTSLFETAVGWMTNQSSTYHGTGEVAGRRGSGTRGMAPYQAFECADGYLILAAPNDKLFRLAADVLGHPEWPSDPRFASNPMRVENRDVLCPLIEAIMRTQPRAHWQERLDAAGVPNAPIQSMDEVAADPQTQALGMIQETSDGRFRLVGIPVAFDGRRPPLRTAGPLIGEHNKEFFGE